MSSVRNQPTPCQTRCLHTSLRFSCLHSVQSDRYGKSVREDSQRRWGKVPSPAGTWAWLFVYYILEIKWELSSLRTWLCRSISVWLPNGTAFWPEISLMTQLRWAELADTCISREESPVCSGETALDEDECVCRARCGKGGRDRESNT